MDTTPARMVREVGTNPSPQQLLEKAKEGAADFGWTIKVRSLLVAEYEIGAFLCVPFSVYDREDTSALVEAGVSADYPLVMLVLQNKPVLAVSNEA